MADPRLLETYCFWHPLAHIHWSGLILGLAVHTAHIRPRSKSNQLSELRCNSPLCDSSFTLLHLYWERSSYIPNSSPIDNFWDSFMSSHGIFPSACSPIFLVRLPEKLVTPKLACHLHSLLLLSFTPPNLPRFAKFYLVQNLCLLSLKRKMFLLVFPIFYSASTLLPLDLRPTLSLVFVTLNSPFHHV